MRLIKKFEEFILEGIVKAQSPDASRARFLMKESERDFEYLRKLVKTMGVNEDGANSMIKLAYDVLMESVRAIMLLKGYNAVGPGAHEAEVSYLLKLNFSENDAQFADRLRYLRNRMMYYGKILDREYALQVLEFTERVLPRVISGSK